MKRLNSKFFERDTLKVARAILGKYITTNLPEGKTTGKIIETEAYCGVADPACHVYGANNLSPLGATPLTSKILWKRGKGRITERNKILFGKPGSVYVYSIYGMYFCLNFVAHRKGKAGGVFIRSIEPINGIELMKKRRKIKDIKSIANGPSKLCIALGINKDFYGKDACSPKSPICLLEGNKIPKNQIKSAPRINIDYAGKAKHYPWRFIL